LRGRRETGSEEVNGEERGMRSSEEEKD